MTKIEGPQEQIDRRRPFWQSFIGQIPYSNLNESLMEAIHKRAVQI